MRAWVTPSVALVCSLALRPALCHPTASLALVPQAGHVEYITDLAFSADGGTLASAGPPGRVILWNVRTGDQDTLDVPASEASCVAFSPDSRLLAAGTTKGEVLLWDLLASRTPRRLTAGQSAVRALCFSPDGSSLAAGGEDSVTIWDVQTHRQRYRLLWPAGGVAAVAISRGASLVAAGGRGGTIMVWDTRTGHEVQMLIAPESCAARAPAGPRVDRVLEIPVLAVGFCVAEAPKEILVAVGADGALQHWDLETGAPLERLHTALLDREAPGEHGVVLSRDGRIVSDGTGIWSALSGEALGSRIESDRAVAGVALSPDSRVLAVGMPGFASIELWDPSSGQLLKRLTGHIARVWSVCFSPDGGRLVVGGPGARADVWDLRQAERDPAIRLQPWGVGVTAAFAIDSSRAAAGDRKGGAVVVWDVASAAPLFTLGETRATDPLVEAPVMTASPSQHLVAAATPQGELNVWDSATGRLQATLSVPAGPAPWQALAFRTDGRCLASANRRAGAVIWDLQTGRAVHTLGEGSMEPTCLAFSPDGALLAVGGRTQGGDRVAVASVVIWDIATETPVRTVPAPGGLLLGLAFAPDGRSIAMAGRALALCAVAPGGRDLVLQPPGQENAVFSVAFSPDGRLLASGGDDGLVKLWDPTTGRLLANLWTVAELGPGGPAGQWVVWTAEGHYNCSERGERYLRVRDARGRLHPARRYRGLLCSPPRVAAALGF